MNYRPGLFISLILLIPIYTASYCLAAPTLVTPTFENVGSGMATLVMQSSDTGTGYFTLLRGSNTSCGTGAQVAAGKTNIDAVAPYLGSLSLTANVAGRYTLRNLTENTDYTACFTADSPSGSNLNITPVSANLTTSTTKTFVDPAWSIVGSPGFSSGTADSLSLVFSPDGTPFVSYVDGGNGNKVTVMKYSNGAWSTLGNVGFSSGTSDSLSLVFSPDGTPFVAYVDGGNGNKVTVMKYSDSTWSTVGSAGFSPCSVTNSSLAFAPDGTPFVAYQENGNGSKASVMKYSDGVWSIVGNAGFSTGGASFISLAFAPTGIPYVAYRDSGAGGKMTVMMYDGAWSIVGNAGIANTAPFDNALVFSPDGFPYVAYANYNGDIINGTGYNPLMVMYGEGGWSEVSSSGLSTSSGNKISLAFSPDSTPYLAYVDFSNNRHGTVMKYDSGTWGVVANANLPTSTSKISLAFAPDGTPYVAYADGYYNEKSTVMKLVNLPTISGTPPTANIGAPYTFAPTATDASSFSINGTLPPGLNFNSATGAVTGIPTTVGSWNNIVITATNTKGSASLPAFSITVLPPNYDLSIAVTGPGVVHTSGIDLACAGSCSKSYTSGTIVTLTAAPVNGYTFGGWSGACSGTGSCNVTMSQAQNVSASFGLAGSCGSANYGNYAVAPTTGLCSFGSPSSVTGIGPWDWSCASTNGGSTTSCRALQAGGIVHRSSDGGVTWSPGKTGLGFNNGINAILASPSYNSDHTVFIGAQGGIYKSSDSGDTWTQVYTTYKVNALAASPAYATDHTLFGGAYLSGFYKSTDSGATWVQSNTGLGNTMIFSLAVSPAFATDRTIYAGLYANGVYKSTDGGATWSATNAGIDTVHGNSLAISPAFVTDRTLFVVAGNRLYRSTDAGSTWSPADTGLTNSSAVTVSPAYVSDQTLFAITSSGIFKSTDRGDSWSQVSTSSVQQLAVSPAYASDQTLFAAVYGDSVYRSTNGGSSWAPATSDFQTVGRRQLMALAISPTYAADHVVFAATYLAGPSIQLSPGTLSFGNVAVGSPSTTRQVTITNGNGMIGDANLAITGMTLSGTGSGQFYISTGSCGTLTPVLPVGSSCNVYITFIPSSAGSKSATLQVASNDLSMPSWSISLSGNGTAVASSTILSPAANSATNASSLSINGLASCSAGDSVSLVEVSSDGGVTWQAANGTTSWGISLPVAQVGSYNFKSRAKTAAGIVESPGAGITVTVERTPPSGTLALYYGVWTLDANSRDGQICIMMYPNICGFLEVSFNGSNWQTATTTPGTSGPLWLRDRAGNTTYISGGSVANNNGGPLRIDGGNYYSFLQHALNAAGSGNTIKLASTALSENLTLSNNVALTIKGGYDSNIGSVTGTTPLNGSLSVQAGSLIIENIAMTGTMTVGNGSVNVTNLTIK